jgi:hypothetical protein
MTRTDLDGLIDNYLRRLDAALSRLPVIRRVQLVSEIAEHLDEARSELANQTEIEVRQLLDRVGRPEDIAAEALADEPEVNRRRPSRIWAVVLTGVALLLALGIGLTVLFAGQGQSTTKAPPNPPTFSTTVTITVPNLLGHTPDQAGNTLRSNSLEFVIIVVPDRAPYPPGVVVSQAPAANSKVARGSTVTLGVTAGPSTTN